MRARTVVCALALTLCFGAARAEMAGSARVIDGATLELAGKRIVLYGAEAPPAGQTCREWSRQGQRDFRCGALARAFMQSLVSGHEVFCVEEGPAEGGRIPATCFANGRDLAAAAVLAGWAVTSQDGSGRYANLQTSAQEGRSGLWAGSSADPDAWRRARGTGR